MSFDHYSKQEEKLKLSVFHSVQEWIAWYCECFVPEKQVKGKAKLPLFFEAGDPFLSLAHFYFIVSSYRNFTLCLLYQRWSSLKEEANVLQIVGSFKDLTTWEVLSHSFWSIGS